MDKVKRLWGDLSLRKSIVLYVVVFVIVALALSVITASVCNSIVENIQDKYPPTGEKYYLTNEMGEQLGEGTYIGTVPTPLCEQDQRLVFILEILPIVAAPIYSALCIIAAALLFYRNKLKKPLAELKAASEKISNNNLDFSITYRSKDELGQLCASFELMRSTLVNNFSEMWRQIEERKQLNAVFAHDLRTPLTVLKGYDEMLQASNDTQTRDTAATMGKHIGRLEYYIDSMSSLRRLEDTQPEYKDISLQEFLSSLSESAYVLCGRNRKKLCLKNRTTAERLSVDTDFISQVCNNLFSNAIRYAASTVTITFEETNNGLLLSVSDDGKGFSKNSLYNATSPYFTEEKNHSEHFGLGLYICKVLCEHHGGYVKIENRTAGATVLAFFKSFVL
ncbi:HAMP domain-containing sensor histidine kinase [Inediibacterium massiliense]|uniref:HAMP domain-containing sensor histidine kinase n=1 Tax=Inediibacterium massiliense TaxID=1658111 RepID=UPI0006B598B5|nr:HAMP domain-containing sensor histidine kinase [Inediibacterium massiliense]